MGRKCWRRVEFKAGWKRGSALVLAASQEEAERLFLNEWSAAEMKLNRFENIQIIKRRKK